VVVIFLEIVTIISVLIYVFIFLYLYTNFQEMNIFQPIQKAFRFYVEGFRHMPSWGRKMWLIILIKGIAIFVIMKILFFPNLLQKNYNNDEERSHHVLEQLTKTR
jgi:hypothetical protein